MISRTVSRAATAFAVVAAVVMTSLTAMTPARADDGSTTGYDSLSPITSTATASSKDMTVEVKAAAGTSTDPAKDTGWADSAVVPNKTVGTWRITISNQSNSAISKLTITTSVSGCSTTLPSLPAGYKKVWTCTSTLNSAAIRNTVTASAPIDPTSATSQTKTVSDDALMMPVTKVSEIGDVLCPVSYATNINDQRKSNASVFSNTVNTVYKTTPTLANCYTAASETPSFTAFSSNKYGRFIYKLTTTFDNPQIWKTDVGKDWEIVPGKALLPENMTSESHVSYARVTCNADWSGHNAATPYTDVVTKNGKPYTLTYTQDDCSNLPQQLRCVTSSSTTASTTVPEASTLTDYSTYSKWITKGVTDPEADNVITVIRNGETTKLDYSVPNLAYGPWFSTNGFTVPATSTSGGINRDILKNKNGTPWNDNVTARADTSLSESSASSVNADKADFTIGNASGTWVKNITASTITKWVSTDTQKYWFFPMGKDTNTSFSFASRWVSNEGTGATQLRQKFDVGAKVTSSQTIITGVSMNGNFVTTNKTQTFDTSATCVSGAGNVKTVRTVNNNE